jgi:hypothetical protein
MCLLVMQFTLLLFHPRWGKTPSSYWVWLKQEIGCLIYNILRTRTCKYITQWRTEYAGLTDGLVQSPSLRDTCEAYKLVQEVPWGRSGISASVKS